ncbi:radical SAM protein [Brasilonema sp. CT11]|nr:radical SAM protein [Brasilonema sp. CT11]
MVQADLNEKFARYLLQVEMLNKFAEGNFLDSIQLPTEAIPCLSARLIHRHRQLLFDEHGRDKFRANALGPAHLLMNVAQMYHIVFDAVTIQQPGFYDTSAACFYLDFYQWSGYLESLPPKVHTVGISVPMGPQLVPALVLARHIKSQRPDLTVIFGGPTLSLMNLKDLDRLLTTVKDIDAVVRFDGELPLLRLVEQRQHQKWEPTKVPAVSSFFNGEVHHVPPEPGPDIKLLPYGDYDEEIMGALADPEIGVIQARGCYWGKCAYCDYVELYKGSSPYRTQLVDRLVEEMEYQIRIHGRNQFAIISESIPPLFARKMSEAIIASGLTLSWVSFAMVDERFTPEVLQLIAQSGCDYLEIGIESMTDRVLKLVEKASTNEKNKNFVRDAAAAGVKLKLNLIPDLPSTTYREALESLEEFRALEDCITFVGVYPFEPTRSSKIGRNPSFYSLKTEDTGNQEGQSQYPANHLISQDPAMTATERQEVHAKFFAFREHINARRNAELTKTLMVTDLDSSCLLRLADEYLDFVEVDDNIQCYHYLTRKLFCVPGYWKDALASVRSSQSFSCDELINWFAEPSIGQIFYQQLSEFRMLMKYTPAEVNADEKNNALKASSRNRLKIVTGEQIASASIQPPKLKYLEAR